MKEPYPVPPFPLPPAGSVALPGSKSITNRALLLAALAEGETTLENALFSEDTSVMATALRALGFEIETDQKNSRFRIRGEGGLIPNREADLFVGNAGTAARFLTALCASVPAGHYRLDGVPQMRRRPIKGLLDALEQMGVEIRSSDGCFPVGISSRGLRPGVVKIDPSESSQLLSALLMVAPLASGEVTVQVAGDKLRRAYVDLTLAVMRAFGQDRTHVSEVNEQTFKVRPGVHYTAPEGGVYSVEPDASAASYFLALPAATGGRIHLPHVTESGLQGDIRFADTLRRCGLVLESTPEGMISAMPKDQRLHGIEEDFYPISDTFLTFAALSPLFHGETTIKGIAHTRKQETDRVSAMAAELRRLGQDVLEEDDFLRIRPQPLREATIRTYEDHRIAMSFAILGCHDMRGDGRPWLRIADPGSCAKTFPGFFDALEKLRSGSIHS